MNFKEEAQKVFEVEAQAILDLKNRIGEDFEKTVDLMKNCRGKVIVTGIGKSGLIGRKISATLSSTGTPSMFLHPAECSHGDLGVISQGDVVLAISYGGESAELMSVISFTSRKDIPMIVMTGRLESSLGKAATVVIDISIKREACPLGLAPTTSTTVTLAMGDALAICLMKEKNVEPQDFAEFHPGGSLGKRLTKVRDIMHIGEGLPLVKTSDSVQFVLSEMTKREVRGVAGVVDEQGFLIGIITDGDVRRHIEKDFDRLKNLTANELMSAEPKTIDANELAEKALFVMEQFKIQNLFAIEKVKIGDEIFPKPVGLLHLQDILQAKVC